MPVCALLESFPLSKTHPYVLSFPDDLLIQQYPFINLLTFIEQHNWVWISQEDTDSKLKPRCRIKGR